MLSDKKLSKKIAESTVRKIQDRQNRQEQPFYDLLDFFGLIVIRDPKTGKREFKDRQYKTLDRIDKFHEFKKERKLSEEAKSKLDEPHP